jgi:hypothetical protein
VLPCIYIPNTTSHPRQYLQIIPPARMSAEATNNMNNKVCCPPEVGDSAHRNLEPGQLMQRLQLGNLGLRDATLAHV